MTQTSSDAPSPSLTIAGLDGHFPPDQQRLLQITLAPLVQEVSPATTIPQKTRDDLQWPQLLEHVADHAQTPEGRFLLDHLVAPGDAELVRRRLNEVDELMELIDTDPAPPLGGFHDIRKAVHHTTKGGQLVIEDLAAIRRHCDGAARVQRYFKSRQRKLPHLSPLGKRISPMRTLRSRLDQSIDAGGELANSASSALPKLRRAVQHQHDRITTRVNQLLQSKRLQTSLRDDYYTLREDRYVLPIRIGAKGDVQGIVHAYSSSGQTAFIEPQELIELNNQLRWAQIDLQDEIDRILAELSALVADHAEALFRNIELLAYLDMNTAIARFGTQIKAHAPTISDGAIELHDARHPLLFLQHDDHKKDPDEPSDTVPNDLAISPPRKALIISGPNTGGKTVTLKTTGLCAMMARFGLPIPAGPKSKIPLFDTIFSDIGDEQSIERDLSTFSGHVTNINSFLERCDADSLVLLDELFVGTDPAQGSALAVALLEFLADRDVTTVVTTHLEGLKTLAYQSDRFANASMGFDLDDLRPTYELTMGIPGRSYAVRIADRLGLNQGIVDRTEAILEGQDHQDIEEVLESLEDQINELEEEKKRLQSRRRDAEIRERRFRDKYQNLLETEREELFDETRDLRKELRQARDLIRTQLKRLRDQKTADRGDLDHRRLQKMQDKLQGAEQALETTRDHTKPPEPGPQGRTAVDPEELEEGMTVYCQPFKREAQILSIDQSAEQVRVQLGDLKANVSFDDLYYGSEKKRRDHQRGRSQHDRPSQRSQRKGDGLLPQNDDNSVDLRGLRVDEALERMDLFLDSAYLNDQRGVYIIHGHGTGALRRAVRGHLPQSRYVDRFRRGEANEGGNGVTIAFLKQ